MKKNIILLFLLLIFSKINAQTLHLIMVSDYADPKFSIVSQADETALISVFKTVEKGINYELSQTNLNINTNTFDSKNVIKTINSLQTKPEDIIVLFYSGFGYYPAKSKSIFPSFKLSDYKKTPLALDDIANKIKAKTVRLGIVLADCRDSFYTPPVNPKPPIVINTPPDAGMVLTEDFSEIILRKIFFEKSGILKIASSSKGESTWQLLNKNNSVFISSFSAALRSLLTQMTTENASLDNILRNSQGRMNNKLKEFDEASEISENKKQTANWVFTPYERNVNTLFKQYPPDTFVYPSEEELKNGLRVIANSDDEIVRDSASKKLLEMFIKDAKIEIKMIDEQTTNLSIEEYISQTAKYDKKKKIEIEFRFFHYKRTKDFKKFISLRFTEKTNQNP